MKKNMNEAAKVLATGLSLETSPITRRPQTQPHLDPHPWTPTPHHP